MNNSNLKAVLRHLNIKSKPPFLGKGQESEVYNLNDEEVLRIYKSSEYSKEKSRKEFYQQIKDYKFLFQLPEVKER